MLCHCEIKYEAGFRVRARGDYLGDGIDEWGSRCWGICSRWWLRSDAILPTLVFHFLWGRLPSRYHKILSSNPALASVCNKLCVLRRWTARRHVIRVILLFQSVSVLLNHVRRHACSLTHSSRGWGSYSLSFPASKDLIQLSSCQCPSRAYLPRLHIPRHHRHRRDIRRILGPWRYIGVFVSFQVFRFSGNVYHRNFSWLSWFWWFSKNEKAPVVKLNKT